MEIEVKTIPHKSQFYETLGDWHYDRFNKLNVYVSDLGVDDYNFLVAIHEMVEAHLCKKRGVDQDAVTKFDREMIEKGIDNPGDDPRAPYHKEHVFASNIERLIMHELGVNEIDYDAAMLQVYMK